MAKQLKTISKTKGQPDVTKVQDLHSDHHPHRFGKTLIWNVDKDNENNDLEMKAYAIAQQMNAGTITDGMLQEVPKGSEKTLIANIEKYLDPKQKLDARFTPNGPHDFGNLTFNRASPAPTAPLSKDEQDLQQEIRALQTKYEGQGQVQLSLIEDENGKKRLLVNVHAETNDINPKTKQPLSKTPRVKLNDVLADIDAFNKKHGEIEVIMGGDMNKGSSALPGEIRTNPNKEVLSHPNFKYQHSANNSSFKRDGSGRAVDAVYSTDKNTQLETLPDMNAANANFLQQFNKSKKEKELLAQQEKIQPQINLQKNLSNSPAFSTVIVKTDTYHQNLDKNTKQDFPVKLVFQDANQARQFTNLVSLRDKKNLFQNEGEIYLTSEAVAKVSKMDINKPKLGVTHLSEGPQEENLSQNKIEDLKKNCAKEIDGRTVHGKIISNPTPPSFEHANTKIRQDTRGEVDYSMKLTFANKDEARAFSDAMGFKNKTLLFQTDNTVYISKDAEKDFLKKMNLVENTASYKVRLEEIKPSSGKDTKDVKDTVTLSSPPDQTTEEDLKAKHTI